MTLDDVDRVVASMSIVKLRGRHVRRRLVLLHK